MSRKNNRRGNIIVLSALLMGFMCAIVAYAVDVGYMYLVRTELQNVADSAALAGAAKLYPITGSSSVETRIFNVLPEPENARAEAQLFAGYNRAAQYGSDDNVFQLDTNAANVSTGDIVVGRLNVPSNQSSTLIPTIISPNSVQVTARLTTGHANGDVSLFFARVLGFGGADISASAVATVRYPTLLPFATSEDKWNSLLTGGDGDNYSYSYGLVTNGTGDGIPEIQIFSDNHWNGNGMPPGNFVALTIGGVTGTDILRAQIDMGPTADQLAYHGEAFERGTRILGNTGVNGSISTAFTGGNADDRSYGGIIGYPRYLPIYNEVTGNGGESLFTIVKFCAARVIAVKMTGGNKHIILQPITESKDLLGVILTR